MAEHKVIGFAEQQRLNESLDAVNSAATRPWKKKTD